MTEGKKRETRALAALEGYKDQVEVVEVVNGTAVIIMKGLRTMTGVYNLTPLNKKARDILEPKKKDGEE